MKKGYKARPHDIAEVTALGAEMIEIHASSEDLAKDIDGKWDIPLAVHMPEYDGKVLLDLAAEKESDRSLAVSFMNKALDKARTWAEHFKGTPKVIIHPGGWSNEPAPMSARRGMYDSLSLSIQELNTSGVDFLIENMPPNPWFYGGQWACNIFMNPTECRDYCTGGLGFCLDVCHAFLYCNSVKMPLMEFVRRVRPVVAHIHFSDGKGVDGEGVQIGEGEMAIKEVWDYIKPLNVGIVQEIWQGHKDGYAGFKTAWDRLEANA